MQKSLKKLHILLIHQGFVGPHSPGGTRHFELARHFVRQGNRFTIIASKLDYFTGQPAASGVNGSRAAFLEGVEVVRTYTFPLLHRNYFWRVMSFLSFSVSSIWAALRVQNVDIVMGTSPPLFQGASAWFVSLIRWRPFLLEIRDLWPDFAIDIGLLSNPVLIWLSRWLERFLYSRATGVVVNSPAYIDFLFAKGVSRNKIHFVPNGVDPSMFQTIGDVNGLCAQLGLEGKYVVTYAGALGMANDLTTLLLAAQQLKSETQVRFLIVGDGKERQNLMAEAERLSLKNVVFAGPQPKSRIATFLAASDACVALLKDIPMFRMTYPNKVFDYMAAGRPVILAIDGVIRKVVEEAKGGIYVPPSDSVALADAVRVLSRNLESGKMMGKSGQAYVKRHFSRHTQADEFARILAKIAAEQ